MEAADKWFRSTNNPRAPTDRPTGWGRADGMGRVDLGDLEHLVLLAILRLGANAYGIPILEEVSAHSGREVSRATIYVALKRLEQKGLVTSRLGDSSPERGGRAKRFFRLRPLGLKVLRDSRRMFLGMWREHERLLDHP